MFPGPFRRHCRWGSLGDGSAWRGESASDWVSAQPRSDGDGNSGALVPLGNGGTAGTQENNQEKDHRCRGESGQIAQPAAGAREPLPAFPSGCCGPAELIWSCSVSETMANMYTHPLTRTIHGPRVVGGGFHITLQLADNGRASGEASFPG